MQVRFIGSGDSFGSGGRHQTCIQVDTEQSRFLFDCGASALIAMAQQGVAPASVDVVLLSHLHGDHCAGVPFLLVHGMLAGKRERPLVVAGPPGCATRLDEMREILFPGSAGMRPRFDYRVIEMTPGEATAIRDLRVVPRRALHTPETSPTMLRVECGGKVIAFTGDTDWTEELVPTAEAADLLISECYFYEKPIRMHMTWKVLRAHRERLRARRVVLTHLSEDMLAHVADVSETCAHDGMVIDI